METLNTAMMAIGYAASGVLVGGIVGWLARRGFITGVRLVQEYCKAVRAWQAAHERVLALEAKAEQLKRNNEPYGQ